MKQKNELIKQVIVVRKDLKMRKGKLAAQIAHAAMMPVVRSRLKPLYEEDPLYQWLKGEFTKIVVFVNSEEELLEIKKKAEEITRCFLITDSGHTEFHGVPTHTCVSIGPDYSNIIDPITGELSLL